jgi:IS5 family transposase
VAKKSKIEPEKKDADTASSDAALVNGSATPEPKKKSRSGATKPKAKKPAAKKSATTPARATARKAASSAREPSDDEIRLRAYFLAERRHQLSLPGDSAHDWIEARRQLIEEAGR